MLDFNNPDMGQLIEDGDQARAYLGRVINLLKMRRDGFDGKLSHAEDYKRASRRYRSALRLHKLLEKDISGDKKRISTDEHTS